jgi:hypothetical protein
MIDFEEISLYLPKYLSESSEQDLFDNLKDFPQNIDARMYSSAHLKEEIIYQGDGIAGLLVVNLPDKTIKQTDVTILSNTCDIDVNNPRMYGTSICYSPIINLDKYLQRLKGRKVASIERVGQFADSVRRQKISQIFFLPKGSKLQSDSFIFFDKINSCDSASIPREELNKKKLFTLSNYGF